MSQNVSLFGSLMANANQQKQVTQPPRINVRLVDEENVSMRGQASIVPDSLDVDGVKAMLASGEVAISSKRNNGSHTVNASFKTTGEFAANALDSFDKSFRKAMETKVEE